VTPRQPNRPIFLSQYGITASSISRHLEHGGEDAGGAHQRTNGGSGDRGRALGARRVGAGAGAARRCGRLGRRAREDEGGAAADGDGVRVVALGDGLHAEAEGRDRGRQRLVGDDGGLAGLAGDDGGLGRLAGDDRGLARDDAVGVGLGEIGGVRVDGAGRGGGLLGRGDDGGEREGEQAGEGDHFGGVEGKEEVLGRDDRARLRCKYTRFVVLHILRSVATPSLRLSFLSQVRMVPWSHSPCCPLDWSR